MKNASNKASSQNELNKLQQEIDRLKSLVDSLDVEKSQLHTDNQALREALAVADDEKRALKEKLDHFIEQVVLARKQKFGVSSEQIDHQINLFNEVESEAEPKAVEPTDETNVVKKVRKQPEYARATMDETLPTEIFEHEVSETDRKCPVCDSELSLLSWRESIELVYVPAVIKRIIHRFPVMYCKPCRAGDEGSTIIEPKRPAALLPKTMASPSIVARIITQKFMLSLPLYRQVMEWEQLGLHLTRQTMSNWLLAMTERYLTPMCERMRHHLLKRDILHADETTLQVLKEPGRAAETKSFMWVYLTGRDGPPIIRYDYQTTRAMKHPQAFLKEFKGYLHADGYSGYHDLHGVTVSGCWAHARRRFHEAVKVIPENKRSSDLPSLIGFDYCERLYSIERQLKDATPEERWKKRQELSLPILEAFRAWLKSIRSSVLRKSLLGNAIHYCESQWPYLTTFLQDGRLEIDNNRAERAIKPFVVGRKNWLFSNTPRGASSSAAIYSMVETARANGLRVERYLRWLFERIPDTGIEVTDALDALMPWSPIVPEECRMTPEEVAADKAAHEKE